MHDHEMELSVQYHVILIRQLNDQILMPCSVINESRHAQSVMGPECSNDHKGSDANGIPTRLQLAFRVLIETIILGFLTESSETEEI